MKQAIVDFGILGMREVSVDDNGMLDIHMLGNIRDHILISQVRCELSDERRGKLKPNSILSAIRRALENNQESPKTGDVR